MTKAEVVNRLAKKTGISHKESVEAVEFFLQSIKDALKRGEKVTLVGFGTFFVKERQARKGRNPRTGASIQIPKKYIASFKPGKAFREEVRNLPAEN